MKPTSQVVHELDHSMPAAHDAQLGRTLDDIINASNASQADLQALATSFKALLEHLDTANVAGIGNTNAATFSPPAATAEPVTALGQRG